MVNARDIQADWLLDDELAEEIGGQIKIAKPQIRQRTSSEKFATAARHNRRRGAWKAGGMHRRNGRQVLKAS